MSSMSIIKTQVSNLVQQKATKNKLNEFVKLWTQEMGNVSTVCKKMKINRSTYYRWLDRYPSFSKDLLREESELNDELKNVLIEKALKGHTAELLFYLKKKHPEFKEQRAVGFRSAVNNQEIEVAIVDY